jgi:hypothetical protein
MVLCSEVGRPRLGSGTERVRRLLCSVPELFGLWREVGHSEARPAAGLNLNEGDIHFKGYPHHSASPVAGLAIRPRPSCSAFSQRSWGRRSPPRSTATPRHGRGQPRIGAHGRPEPPACAARSPTSDPLSAPVRTGSARLSQGDTPFHFFGLFFSTFSQGERDEKFSAWACSYTMRVRCFCVFLSVLEE